VDANHPAFEQALKATKARVQSLIDIKGTRSVDSFHRELGLIMWDYCGMARSAQGLTEAIGKIQNLRKQFWSDLKLLGAADGIDMELERAGRVADFLEFGGVRYASTPSRATSPVVGTSAPTSDSRWRGAPQR
jgi:succinate dehydrogenase / fumarate reductase flavoprotein subunit